VVFDRDSRGNYKETILAAAQAQPVTEVEGRTITVAGLFTRAFGADGTLMKVTVNFIDVSQTREVTLVWG